MPKYEIQRWDPVIPKGNGQEPYPMVYIKPTEDFFDYMKENNNLFAVTISDTESAYDGKVVALSDISAYFPNFRPNFFNKTGYYTIMLFSNWVGYPEKNGSIFIQGLKGPDAIVPVETPFVPPEPVQEYYSPKPVKENQFDSLSFRGLTTIVLALLAIMIATILLAKR